MYTHQKKNLLVGSIHCFSNNNSVCYSNKSAPWGICECLTKGQLSVILWAFPHLSLVYKEIKWLLVFPLLLPSLQKVSVHLSVWRCAPCLPCPKTYWLSSSMQSAVVAMFRFDHGVQTPTQHTTNGHLQSRRKGLCGLNRKFNTSAGHHLFSLHYSADRLPWSLTSHHHQSVASLSTHIDPVFFLPAN